MKRKSRECTSVHMRATKSIKTTKKNQQKQNLADKAVSVVVAALTVVILNVKYQKKSCIIMRKTSKRSKDRCPSNFLGATH